MDAIFTIVYEWGGVGQGVTGRHRQGAADEEAARMRRIPGSAGVLQAAEGGRGRGGTLGFHEPRPVPVRLVLRQQLEAVPLRVQADQVHVGRAVLQLGAPAGADAAIEPDVLEGGDQHCCRSGPPPPSSRLSLTRDRPSDSPTSPPTPGALTPAAAPRGNSLALGLSLICAVPSSILRCRASEGRAAPFSGWELVEAVLSRGGLALRFLGKVRAMRSRSGSPDDIEEVELDLGKGLGPPAIVPGSSVEVVFPVRSPRVFLMSRGVKNPANPLQPLPLVTCDASPPPEGFCPKAAPQQRD
ncbi:hypothetical protein EYF80_000530 [Liparis tanakae]|uniref:Uncharacterized protein n=1 Tax=Liparis tanakae TaxID=230148 RepID=A0A4Z2JJ22_9TELE|nr:hypothetical protein EYF80_000530 [Liparis tanakae]